MTSEDLYFDFEFMGLKIERVLEFGDVLTTFSITIAAIALWISLRNFRNAVQQGNQDAKVSHYSELDRFYSELLTLSLTYPFLRSPKTIAHDDEAIKADYSPFTDADQEKISRYENYALMMWNFIEAIHDRCQDLWVAGDNENYHILRDTWEPIIRAENRIHRPWFLSEMRRNAKELLSSQDAAEECHKFCTGFRIFIFERQWADDDWTYRDGFKNSIDFGLESSGP
ncbi:MAG: hypothetical protein RIC29_08390 [Rhodospirillaceae bacterium]